MGLLGGGSGGGGQQQGSNQALDASLSQDQAISTDAFNNAMAFGTGGPGDVMGMGGGGGTSPFGGAPFMGMNPLDAAQANMTGDWSGTNQAPASPPGTGEQSGDTTGQDTTGGGGGPQNLLRSLVNQLGPSQAQAAEGPRAQTGPGGAQQAPGATWIQPQTPPWPGETRQDWVTQDGVTRPTTGMRPGGPTAEQLRGAARPEQSPVAGRWPDFQNPANAPSPAPSGAKEPSQAMEFAPTETSFPEPVPSSPAAATRQTAVPNAALMAATPSVATAPSEGPPFAPGGIPRPDTLLREIWALISRHGLTPPGQPAETQPPAVPPPAPPAATPPATAETPTTPATPAETPPTTPATPASGPGVGPDWVPPEFGFPSRTPETPGQPDGASFPSDQERWNPRKRQWETPDGRRSPGPQTPPGEEPNPFGGQRGGMGPMGGGMPFNPLMMLLGLLLGGPRGLAMGSLLGALAARGQGMQGLPMQPPTGGGTDEGDDQGGNRDINPFDYAPGPQWRGDRPEDYPQRQGGTGDHGPGVTEKPQSPSGLGNKQPQAAPTSPNQGPKAPESPDRQPGSAPTNPLPGVGGTREAGAPASPLSFAPTNDLPGVGGSAAAAAPSARAINANFPTNIPGSSRDDAAYITQNHGHSTIGTPNNRGSYGAYTLNPEFTRRLAAAGRAYSAETGQAPRYGEGDRDARVQAIYYRNYITGRGGLAAQAGHSLHQQGLAMDIPDGPFYGWLRRNSRRFGLGFPLANDTHHLQMQHGGRPYPYTPQPEPGTNRAA